MTYDSLLESVGSFGIYQKKLFAIFFVNGIPNALLLTSIVFLHYMPEHQCTVDHLIPNNISRNSTLFQEISAVIGYRRSVENTSNSCLMYNVSQQAVELMLYQGVANFTEGVKVLHRNASLLAVPCQRGHSYDKNGFVQSAMMEFNGVCEQAWYKPFISSLYLAGMGFAALSGVLSDKFGRRPVFLFFTCLQFVVTFFTSFANEIRVYGACIFLCGLTQMVNYMAAFVLGTECTTPEYRNFISVSSFYSFSLGYMIGPLISYLIPNWRWMMRFNGLVGLLYIPMYWLIPESPRWLLAKGKIREAKVILLKIAKDNGQLDKMDAGAVELISKETVVKADENNKSLSTLRGLLELVRNPKMMVIVVVIEIAWCATAVVYFGLSLSAQNLNGNLFINCFLLGVLEIPGVLAAYIAVRYFSRPKSHAFFMFLAGVCCLVAALLKSVNGNATLAASLLGKAANSGVYYLVYIHSAEIAPTVSRNSLMCIGSIAGRIGSVIAPYFVYMVELYGFFAPFLALSAVTLTSAWLTLLFLPETRLQPLPDTVQDTLRLKTICQKIVCGRWQKKTDAKTAPA
uniref:Solute carrier family 22 member 5-like n=1 Tax=Phallusia mammillata TaxID=59560 RepID=A0A6F9DT20_9ASCI|nr:solute carrier family 22 member 5-like [Phallusia mammillata]